MAIAATADTSGVEKTTSMQTTAADRDAYGDSTVVQPGSSPTIGASADPTPVAGPTETADPMVTFAGASRMSGPASAPPSAPGPTDVLGGVPATPIPPPSRATTAPVSPARARTASPRTPAPAPCPGSRPAPAPCSDTATGWRSCSPSRRRSVTWRAFDLVLSRSVVVHLLAPPRPRGTGHPGDRSGACLARRRLPFPAGPRRGPQRRSRARLLRRLRVRGRPVPRGAAQPRPTVRARIGLGGAGGRRRAVRCPRTRGSAPPADQPRHRHPDPRGVT